MSIQRLINDLFSPGKAKGKEPPPLLEPCFDGSINHFESLQSQPAPYWLNFPLPKSNEKPKEKAVTPQGLKVLLVEDNLVNQRLTGHVLKKLGLTADYATDGSTGVDLVKKGSYDLILMDIHMPVMDGVEATRIIRTELREGKNIRIIGLTASAIREDHDSYIMAGMDDVLVKPLKLESLKSKISAWFT
ncbi:MAG: response regulator [Bacteroidia bacterium]